MLNEKKNIQRIKYDPFKSDISSLGLIFFKYCLYPFYWYLGLIMLELMQINPIIRFQIRNGF